MWNFLCRSPCPSNNAAELDSLGRSRRARAFERPTHSDSGAAIITSEPLKTLCSSQLIAGQLALPTWPGSATVNNINSNLFLSSIQQSPEGLHPTSPSNPISTPVERRLQNFRFQSQFAKKMSETDAGGQQPPQQQAKLTEYTQQFVWNKPLVEAPPVRVEPLTSQYQRDFKQWPLHAVQQANGRAADTVDAVSVVSATSNTSKGSKGRASVAQSFEPRLAPAVKQSEYHAKFKPFTEYVYVEGDGFRAEAAADQQQPRAADLVDGKTKEWYREVEERSRQACKYRARSQMGVEPHGEHAWDGAKVADHDLQALALATRLLIEEKRAERQSAGPKGRSASAKPFNRKSSRGLSSAPASLRDSSMKSTTPTPTSGTAIKSIRGRKAAPSNSAENESHDQVDRNNNTINKEKPAAGKPSAAAGGGHKSAEPSSKLTARGAARAPGEKVWIKPKKANADQTDKAAAAATPATSGGAAGSETPKAVTRKKSIGDSSKSPTSKTAPTSVEVRSVPLRTTRVRSPEELSGIKSPSPESWKVSIEKGGLNWVNGGPAGGGGGGQQSAHPPTLPPPLQFDQSPPTTNISSSAGGAGAGLGTNDMVKPVPINGRN